MKVWVVHYQDWDSAGVYGVFSTKELAEQFVDSHMLPSERDEFTVECFEVDAGISGDEKHA
jgi:hypothetical protein